MSNQKTDKLQAVIQIPKGLAVHKDKKSGAQSVWFPFRMIDGTNAVLTVTKLTNLLDKMPFVPDKDLEAILIQFPNENTTTR